MAASRAETKKRKTNRGKKGKNPLQKIIFFEIMMMSLDDRPGKPEGYQIFPARLWMEDRARTEVPSQSKSDDSEHIH